MPKHTHATTRQTIRKGHIEYTIHPAPASPLGLKMSTIYAPRTEPAPGMPKGYNCVEAEKGWFLVSGWGEDMLWTMYEGEDLVRAYRELATYLGMTS